MELMYKNVEDINVLKDDKIKYSQFILLIKSLVDNIKNSKHPFLTVLSEYKKIFEIINTIKNFVFDPTPNAISIVTMKEVMPEEKIAEVEEMINVASLMEQAEVKKPTEVTEIILSAPKSINYSNKNKKRNK